MIKLLAPGDEKALIARVGEEIFRHQQSSRHICAPVGEGGLFIAMRYYDMRTLSSGDAAGGHIALYCGDGELLVLSANKRIMDIVRAMDESAAPFRALARLFDDMTCDDVDALERMELDITALEDGLITGHVAIRTASTRIIQLRRAVLKTKRYYEQLDIIMDRICENENGAVPEDALHLFNALARRIDRLIESAAHMSECIAQASDTYQAQIDIEQNQIMKIFTVLSAVFMPLTLIAGWYGMNFIIPEYQWPMGYAYVGALSLTVCALCFLIFKRKRWF